KKLLLIVRQNPAIPALVLPGEIPRTPVSALIARGTENLPVPLSYKNYNSWQEANQEQLTHNFKCEITFGISVHSARKHLAGQLPREQ
ncbi:MAG: hypothetical protein Q4C59_15005, partial [Lachnospiraceae bacterium]|nr:hypothetical protein [Lachnospiraceae bacterium]